jgi:hypothetical protein
MQLTAQAGKIGHIEKGEDAAKVGFGDNPEPIL